MRVGPEGPFLAAEARYRAGAGMGAGPIHRTHQRSGKCIPPPFPEAPLEPHVQLIVPQILGNRQVRGATQKRREFPDRADLSSLRGWRNPRAVMSSIMRRRNGLMDLSVMGPLPVLSEVRKPQISTQDRPNPLARRPRRLPPQSTAKAV